MAALVQTYPQQTSTVTLLQTRPRSTSEIMAGTSQGSQQRSPYHTTSGSTSGNQHIANQRVGNSGATIQPYAFTSTPNLANGNQWQQYSAYAAPTMSHAAVGDARPRGMSNPSNGGEANNRPTASRTPSSSAWAQGNGQPTFAQVAASKASPDRYRRPVARHTESSPASVQQPLATSTASGGSGTATVLHVYNPRTMADQHSPSSNSSPRTARPQSAYGSLMMGGGGVTVDDMQLFQQRKDEEAKRFRRRSMHSIDFSSITSPLSPQQLKQSQGMQRFEQSKPRSGSVDKGYKSGQTLSVPKGRSSPHTRSPSSESLGSSRSSNSRPSSANRNAALSTGSSASALSGSKTQNTQDHQKVNIPPRNSSTDVGKRATNPSPLSKPANLDSDAAAKPPTSSSGPKPDSPAARQLAAINEKGGKSKTKTSRLRRAFSFGSAAELRKATGQDAEQNGQAQKEAPTADDLYEEEQARIAQKQEEAGIGASIYSGTGLFSGSTDNLSISSTASSASIMLRKMGRGVKKGGRSLKGLFRPKSMIGAPIGESDTPEASQAAVSMVTVEAETQRVNVNGDVHSQQAGGTGFPHLERNSVETGRAEIVHVNGDGAESRKSILGGERERAEVLATIRKGILKTRSDSPSPAPSGNDTKAPTFELPPIPNVSDSPNSSMPTTPNDDVHQGHRRSGSVAIGSEDYFVSALRLRQDTKSAPTTPQGSSKRNATFSPRIIFYDTWPPGEYDRRGEIATCNRLTPMLAQQIKEELNSFKMEMEVHETSKIYTHFF